MVGEEEKRQKRRINRLVRGILAGIIDILERRCGEFFFKKIKIDQSSNSARAIFYFTVNARATLLPVTCGTRENRK
jgi:hypothetical protein